MAQNFIACDRDQELLLPPSLREWLPEDHLAWFVLDSVAELDLDGFYAAYRADGWGAAAHDPQMMVALLLYAYAIGVRSARGIERRCSEDVAFRVIAANQAPDHATIARFRARHEQAISELFWVCSRCARGRGWSRSGSSRSTARSSPPPRPITRTAATSRSRRRSSRRRAGSTPPRTSSTARRAATSCPRGCARAGDRRKWLREAKQALEAERAAKAKTSRATAPSGLQSASAGSSRTGQLERRVVAEHAAWHARGIASDGSRRMTGARANIKPYPLTEKPAGKLNVTDPDSRNLKTTRGWVQGYNAQAAVTAEQIVVAAEITTESLDTANLAADGRDRPRASSKPRASARSQGVVLADAGYWKNDAIEAIVGQGIQTLVAPDADSRKEPRPGRRGGLYDFTRRVLATDWGKELYLKRQGTVEPVFGQIKSNRGANRFLRRGRSAVRSEWRLLAATHNLLKLHKHQLAHLTPGAGPKPRAGRTPPGTRAPAPLASPPPTVCATPSAKSGSARLTCDRPDPGS